MPEQIIHDFTDISSSLASVCLFPSLFYVYARVMMYARVIIEMAEHWIT